MLGVPLLLIGYVLGLAFVELAFKWKCLRQMCFAFSAVLPASEAPGLQKHLQELIQSKRLEDRSVCVCVHVGL